MPTVAVLNPPRQSESAVVTTPTAHSLWLSTLDVRPKSVAVNLVGTFPYCTERRSTALHCDVLRCIALVYRTVPY